MRHPPGQRSATCEEVYTAWAKNQARANKHGQSFHRQLLHWLEKRKIETPPRDQAAYRKRQFDSGKLGAGPMI